MSRSFGPFRVSFLARFAVSTFLAAVLAATALAYVLIDRHLAAIESDEGISAAGQVAQILSAPLANVWSAHALSAHDRKALSAANEAAKRLQFVSGFRVYRHDGSELFPTDTQTTPAAVRADLTATLASMQPWSRNTTNGDGDFFVEYMPFATRDTIFVVAIDLSRALLSNQARGEAGTIVVSTAGAIALVFFSLVALAAGASRELEYRRRQATETFVKTLTVLAEVIDHRDPYTAGHSTRVAAYTRLLAIELGLPSRTVELAEHAALLHDLGKIGIPDSVLLKPSKLDPDERETMEMHPVIGGRILGSVSTMDEIAPCVLHHHERLDGRGYPAGLLGDEIPLGARLVAVADTYDAMTTDRPYRRALPVATAVAEMRRVAGTQLEPAHVEAFVRLVERGAVTPPDGMAPARHGSRLLAEPVEAI